MAFIVGLSPLALVGAVEQKKGPAPLPVAIESAKASLTPQNTTIEFTGLHTGAEPNPRVGYFAKFKGQLTFDEETGTPRAATIEIDTNSLVAPIDKLTNHLKSPDFFDARQFPKATFKTTKIEPTANASGPTYKVTGDLTIRDITKSITFPATVKVTDAGVVLESKFKLKRSEFGMNFGPDRVVDEVSMSVIVGKKTPKVEPTLLTEPAACRRACSWPLMRPAAWNCRGPNPRLQVMRP